MTQCRKLDDPHRSDAYVQSSAQKVEKIGPVLIGWEHHMYICIDSRSHRRCSEDMDTTFINQEFCRWVYTHFPRTSYLFSPCSPLLPFRPFRFSSYHMTLFPAPHGSCPVRCYCTPTHSRSRRGGYTVPCASDVLVVVPEHSIHTYMFLV